MRGYKRKFGKKTYPREVHEFALRHLGLARTVAARRAGPRGDRYRDLDDLRQEAYIGMLSTAAEVVSGELPESEFGLVAARRMKAKVNQVANRTHASISVPWHTVLRIWRGMRSGESCGFPQQAEAFLEEIPEDEWSEWADDLIAAALSRLDPADESILRDYYGIGRVMRPARESAAELGLCRESICRRVRIAERRLRPILEELMEADS